MSEDEKILDGAALDRLKEWGGPELVQKMITLFLEVAPQRLEEIRAGILADDVSRAERGAHSLKSSAGNLGAEAVRALASRIEAWAEAEDRESLRSALPELEERFERTAEELRRRQDPTSLEQEDDT